MIDSFEQLFDATAPDFTPIYERVSRLGEIEAGAASEGDRVVALI